MAPFAGRRAYGNSSSLKDCSRVVFSKTSAEVRELHKELIAAKELKEQLKEKEKELVAQTQKSSKVG